jgi:hypothetical protein
MQSSHRLGLFIFFLSFMVLIMSISFLSIIFAFINNDRIAFGVRCEGIPLNGLSRQETTAVVARTTQKKFPPYALLFIYEDKQWKITPEQINLHIDVDGTVQAVYGIGRRGSFLENLAEQLSCAFYGHPVTPVVSYDTAALQKHLETIASSINSAPVSAFCQFDGHGRIRHIPAVAGKTLHTDDLASAAAQSLDSLELPGKITLAPQIQAPAIEETAISTIDTILASYTTHFSPANANRSQNIQIAASELNQRLIPSGSTFSFNDTVGPRLASSGYKDAAVILDGKVEQDIGGGVCQVSSTLYNAILLADLTPAVRTAHFYPSTYVPAGLDATVADGQIDFVFRNSLPHSVYLLSAVYGDSLTVYVLGTQTDLAGKDITLATHIDKPGPGPTVSAWRVYTRDGKEIKREFLHTDQYDVSM